MKQKKDMQPITKDDLTILENNISKSLNSFQQSIHLGIDYKLDMFKIDIEEKFKQYMSEFMTRVDPLISDIDNSRIHREITTDDIMDLKRKSADYEKRIKKLEDTLKTS